MVDCVWLCCLTYVIVWMSRVKASFKRWSILITNLGKQSSFFLLSLFFFVCVCAVALVISLFMIYIYICTFNVKTGVSTQQIDIFFVFLSSFYEI